jgi:transposase
MRGHLVPQGKLFFTIDVESRIRADHPLRSLKRTVDEILRGLSDKFAAAYSQVGRPSVPPERLLKALLLMALYSIRSERQLAERIDMDLMFRWFLDMSPDDPAFDATTFTHNRPRLDAQGLTAAFFDAVLRRAINAGLTSDEHFSVDGTLIESYASTKSFRPVAAETSNDSDRDEKTQDSNSFKPRNAEVNFHGQQRTNLTHASRTDPEAKLYRKSPGQEAKLCHLGHALTENRNGLVMGVAISEANGTAEPAAALEMLDRLHQRLGKKPQTLGSDKGFDSGPYYLELESRGIVPHSAMIETPPANPKHLRAGKRPAFEARCRMRERLLSEGYRISQRCRKKVEECFGWIKTVAGLARSRHVGRWKLRQQMELAAAAYNLVRMRKLMPT